MKQPQDVIQEFLNRLAKIDGTVPPDQRAFETPEKALEVAGERLGVLQALAKKAEENGDAARSLQIETEVVAALEVMSREGLSLMLGQMSMLVEHLEKGALSIQPPKAEKAAEDPKWKIN